MQSRRMARETATVEIMIRHFCHEKHGQNHTLCPDCHALIEYALKRLKQCPFQENKTTCGKCSIHCYKPAMRKKIQEVMRTVGPKMLFSHPINGLMHLIDGLRKKPKK